MYNIIQQALKLGLWRQLDVQFAYMLVNNDLSQNSLILAIITLSFYVHRGHVCLPLSMLTPTQLFFGLHLKLANEAYEKAGNLSIFCWEKLLFSSFIVSDGSSLAPLVLDQKKLYLYRFWKNECLVADFFHHASQEISIVSKNEIRRMVKLLNQFFPVLKKDDKNKHIKKSKCINWQKIAIAMVLIRRLVVISGGPGTGKTSIISKLLIILSLLHYNFQLNIKMATPTGKSAARLNESINLMVKEFDLSHFYKNSCFSVQAITLHRLLGIYSNKENIQRVRNNFFSLDYLIIDESSMIDLSMMAKLVTTLSSTTKIIFLGDHNQLPSVESGSVFSDICHFIGTGYTFKFFKYMKNLTDYILPLNKENKYNIIDSLCLLKKNYRFSISSGIGKLAHAISLGDHCMVLSLLTSNANEDLNYIDFKNDTDYSDMLITCAFGYLDYFKIVLSYCNDKDLSFILNFFNQYRILCALREGPFGVVRLNFLIENILNYYGFIQLTENQKDYIGRPIIITSNAPSLSLFNGEVGIILPDSNLDNITLFAYFLSSDNSIKKIALHKLPKCETNFVMSIHKSQGSEFENIALIFPNKIMPILSRELLYTGITRARKSLSIYATDQVINYSINNQCKRHSGLVDRLKRLQGSSLYI